MTTAAYFGTFDPITLGHLDVVEVGAKLFDKLHIVIAKNPKKKAMFSLGKREEMVQVAINQCMQKYDISIQLHIFDGLASDFCKTHSVDVILRGVRNGSDLDSENALAHYNQRLSGVPTLYVPPTPEHIYISSSAVRELLTHGQDVSDLVPALFDSDM